MKLTKLQLYNFRNYSDQVTSFGSRINVLVGKNGSGKTNLLDAIYFLAYTKSAFQNSDSLLVRFGEQQLFVKGHFQIDNTVGKEVLCVIQQGSPKTVTENQVPYEKLSEHIGKYPVVFMDPQDVQLVTGTGEVRRKFFDGILAQTDPDYLNDLLRYNHQLKQRNSLLRMFSERGNVDWTAVDSYDEVLILHGSRLHEKREAFIRKFIPIFTAYYKFLTNQDETPTLEYISPLFESDMQAGLLKNRPGDLSSQRTRFGPHKDDFEFLLDGVALRKFGSQGQQKSFVIALKLAQWKCLKESRQSDPIMLMDDIFDKLDDYRIHQLLELIRGEFGQMFITDARPERTQDLLRAAGVEATSYLVQEGSITEQGNGEK